MYQSSYQLAYQSSRHLCPYNSTSSRVVHLLAHFACLLLVGSLGCDRASPTTSASQSAATPANTAFVPLRVWVVGPIVDEQIWMRHWLAGSEQQIEFRSVKTEDLLPLSQCDCDVILYPARLIGELTERGWIVKLPDSVDLASGVETGDSQVAPLAWRQQATYAEQTMGIALGCSLPVFIATSAFPVADNMRDWSTLLKDLQLAEIDSPQFNLTEQQVDREALVDRFLAIVATLSNRDPSYGLLFDLQSMRSRLADENFIRCARILAALASQPDGLAAMVRDHSVTWSWISRTTRDLRLAVATPATLNTPWPNIVVSGQVVRVGTSTPGLADNSSADADAVTDRPRVMAWNSGSGLVASLSSQCRQSNQAVSLLRWLSQPSTRSVLTKFTVGIESPTPVASAETLAWKARQSLSEVVTAAAARPRATAPALATTHIARRRWMTRCLIS